VRPKIAINHRAGNNSRLKNNVLSNLIHDLPNQILKGYFDWSHYLVKFGQNPLHNPKNYFII